MPLVVAVIFGVASAAVYGAATVVQHRMAQQHADGTGDASAAGLLRLVRSPLWLLATGGDVVGFALQVVALSTGPVVVIQPLVVLMLPISLAVSLAMGWHKRAAGDLLGVAGMVGGLAVFLALIGQPAPQSVPHWHSLGLAVLVVLIGGAAAAAAAIGRNSIVKGTVYGAVAGCYYGLFAVMVDAASARAADAGIVHGLLTSPRGLVPLAGIGVLGVGGLVLTQMSFQVGALGAALPASVATDPVLAVICGVVLLREHVPLAAPDLVAYALCLVAVVAGAIRLANPPSAGAIDTPSRPPGTR